MATLKCLACGHDNNVGEESCASCSSSLNLKLCSACEAINANNAERCHSCKAQFRAEPEVVSFEMQAPPGELVEWPAPAGRTLPAVWRMAAEGARIPRSRSAPALAVVALVLAALPLVVVAGLAYHFYAPSQAAKAPEPSTKLEAAVKRVPNPKANPEVSPGETARLQVAEPKPAPTPVVSARIAPSRPAPAPSRNTPLPEPKRTTAPVTHTRAAGADTPSRASVAEPSRAAAAEVPRKTDANAALPVVAARPTPAASAAILPVSETPGITHTKAAPTEAAATTTAPPAATEGRTVPAEAKSDETARCAPGVVALGLCNGK